MSGGKTTTNAGVIVTGALAFANWVFPLLIPPTLRPIIGTCAWTAFILSCAAWSFAHIKWLRRVRQKWPQGNPMAILFIFLICGAVGVILYRFVRPALPELPDTTNTETEQQPSLSQPAAPPRPTTTQIPALPSSSVVPVSPSPVPNPSSITVEILAEKLANSIAEPPPPERAPVGTEPLFTKPTFPATKKCRFKVLGYEHFTEYDVEALKVTPQSFVFNEGAATIYRPLAAAYVGTDGILCVDATIYGGIRVRGNHYSKLPPSWDMNWNDLAVEIVNDKHVPMYSLRLLRPGVVELRGILLFASGEFVSIPSEGGPYEGKLVRLDHGVMPPGTMPEQARRIFKYPGQLNRGERETDEKFTLPW